LQIRSQENAVSKIVSLRPDQDQHNKPKTKNKDKDHDQNHILLVWDRSCNKTKSQTTSVVHCVV